MSIKGIKFREHRGSLRASMSTEQQIESAEALREHLNSLLLDSSKKIAELKYEYTGYDERVDWDTYYVLQRLEGETEFTLVGFSTGFL